MSLSFCAGDVVHEFWLSAVWIVIRRSTAAPFSLHFTFAQTTTPLRPLFCPTRGAFLLLIRFVPFICKGRLTEAAERAENRVERVML